MRHMYILLLLMHAIVLCRSDAPHKTQLLSFPMGWKDPRVTLTDPPSTMNKQMGQVTMLGIPPLGYEMDGNVKVFRLTAQPIEKTITGPESVNPDIVPEEYKDDFIKHAPRKSQHLRAWGYNGSTPGPTIEAYEGDRVRVILKNELPEPTSIHWHGLEIPNHQDGAAGETQRPVLPGETYTYEFTLYQSGTLMYHSGYNIMKQDLMGLAGLFVIHPKRGYEQKIDKDFAIMLQQWTLLPGNPYPDIENMLPNWATFNSLAAPHIPYMQVNQGDRVRIRFGNISFDNHPIHLHGYRWLNVGTAGGPIPPSARWYDSTVDVPPGATRDVEFTAWNPGIWRMHCHKVHHAVNAHVDVPMGIMRHGGMFTLLYVIPKDDNAPWTHPDMKSHHTKART